MPRPAAGQEGRHQGFYPLNSHFLLFLSLTQTGDRRPLRKGERQRIFSPVGEHSVLPCRNLYAVPDTVLLHRSATSSRRGMTVPRNSLTRYTARHLRIRRLVQFIFVGAVYHNALTNCAALLCRAQRRFSDLCSSNVSDTANRLRKTRKKKSSAVPIFEAVTYRKSAPD